MAQHGTFRFDIALTQQTLILLVEAVILLFLTFAGAAIIRRPGFQKAFRRTFISSFRAQKRQERPLIVNNENLVQQKPFVLPPLKTGMSTKMTMTLRRLDKDNWLSIDECYHAEHIARSSHLNQHKPDVLQCLPGSEAACAEVLDHVSTFLSARYPEYFTITQSNNMRSITNHLTGEKFPLGSENKEPLETAARLAMEDFNVLVRDDEGQYRLQASATLFPAGWILEERIGGTMSDLHKPVPSWKKNLGSCVNRLVIQFAISCHPFLVQNRYTGSEKL